MSTFEPFQLKPYLMSALEELGFQETTEVQERLIPVILKKRNVVGQSQTGTGKTHTFLLPLFQQLDETKQRVQIVITAPSRELSQQIYQAASQLAQKSATPIRIGHYIGGTDKKRQMAKLAGQQPQIVIGTPGRILDLMQEQALDIHEAFALVVDEADMTLDLGFLPDVDKIAGSLGKNAQLLVFSATIPERLRPFLRKYLENPVMEQIEPKQVLSSTIENWLISTKARNRKEIVHQCLTIGHPYLAIVFANTKQTVDEYTDYLRAQGLKVAKIHGDISPRERKRVMKQVQNLEYQYVVATDLAARGIDIEGVSHVINAEIPRDLEFFVHRVGRTGRKGMSGTAITLFDPSEEEQIAIIEKMGVTFEPKEIKNGEIVTTYDRNRRVQRERSQKELDTTMVGLVKKKKKKVKPGYKKKLKWAIDEDARKKRKVERRQSDRADRKQRKQNFQQGK